MQFTPIGAFYGDAEYKYAITCTLEKGLRENTYISR